MTTVEPLVSILIPVVTDNEHLAAAIDSALAQTWPRTEVIVVDGSTDGGRTQAVVAAYRGQVRYLSQPGADVGTALGAGIAAAQGEFVCWLHPDDRYLPRKVDVQVRTLLARPEPAIAYSDSLYVDDDWRGGRRRERPLLVTGNPDEHPLWGLFNGRFRGCALLLPKRCLTAHGKHNDRGQPTIDGNLWLQLARSVPFVPAPGYLVRCGQPPDLDASLAASHAAGMLDWSGLVRRMPDEVRRLLAPTDDAIVRRLARVVADRPHPENEAFVAAWQAELRAAAPLSVVIDAASMEQGRAARAALAGLGYGDVKLLFVNQHRSHDPVRIARDAPAMQAAGEIMHVVPEDDALATLRRLAVTSGPNRVLIAWTRQFAATSGRLQARIAAVLADEAGEVEAASCAIRSGTDGIAGLKDGAVVRSATLLTAIDRIEPDLPARLREPARPGDAACIEPDHARGVPVADDHAVSARLGGAARPQSRFPRTASAVRGIATAARRLPGAKVPPGPSSLRDLTRVVRDGLGHLHRDTSLAEAPGSHVATRSTLLLVGRDQLSRVYAARWRQETSVQVVTHLGWMDGTSTLHISTGAGHAPPASFTLPDHAACLGAWAAVHAVQHVTVVGTTWDDPQIDAILDAVDRPLTLVVHDIGDLLPPRAHQFAGRARDVVAPTADVASALADFYDAGSVRTVPLPGRDAAREVVVRLQPLAPDSPMRVLIHDFGLGSADRQHLLDVAALIDADAFPITLYAIGSAPRDIADQPARRSLIWCGPFAPEQTNDLIQTINPHLAWASDSRPGPNLVAMIEAIRHGLPILCTGAAPDTELLADRAFTWVWAEPTPFEIVGMLIEIGHRIKTTSASPGASKLPVTGSRALF